MTVDEVLPLGKVPNDLLAGLLQRYAKPDHRLVVGPGIGHDAAAISFGGSRAIVVKTDPITFATADLGWYLVNVNANDLACLGAEPHWLVMTALLPAGQTTPRTIEALFADVADACSALGIVLAGGHTEITHGLDRPILVGTLLGEVEQTGLIAPGRARSGDRVILTKGIAIEGTALIASAAAQEISAHRGQSFVDRCRAFLREPGISVVRDARVARASGAVHALHDPTEGGIATGLRELAEAAQLGLVVDLDAITVYPETRTLCVDFGIDPLGLVASGGLLIAAPDHATAAILHGLHAEGISASVIGTFTARERGIRQHRGNHESDLVTFAADEITRLFQD